MIVEQGDQDCGSGEKVIFANEIANLLFCEVLKQKNYKKMQESLLTEKVFFRYQRSQVFE